MLGDKLRAERERQSLTIKDIEKGTSIRALYIESIEKGNYDILPGEVYTKGFIRNYANFLKLDDDAFVQEFNEENHPEQIVQKETEITKSEQQADNDTAFTVDSDFKVSFGERAKQQNKFLAAALCLLVLGGGYFLFSTDSDKQAANDVKTTKQVQNGIKENPKTEESKVAATPVVKHDDVEVVAKFDDRCWTQVIADGQTLYEGTMEKGKTMSWKGKEIVSITAGNAGAVALSVNGQDVGKVGEIGQVVEKVFTPGGEKKKGSGADEKEKDK